jgi:hypothetical protein
MLLCQAAAAGVFVDDRAFADPFVAPGGQRHDDRLKIAAFFREHILAMLGFGSVRARFHYAQGDETLQRTGEDVRPLSRLFWNSDRISTITCFGTCPSAATYDSIPSM